MKIFLSMACIAFLLAGCGGGGGGTSAASGGASVPTAPTATPPPLSTSGDMIAYTPYRGWNYTGHAFGYPAVTVSIYADPQAASPSSGPVDPLIMFAGTGTAANAFSATKLAGIGIQSNANGYILGSYVLLNNTGGVYASGSVNPFAGFVPSTLVQGATFSPYPGATATITFVGAVPGTAGCPTPAMGATVAYTFMGGNYSISYVPGCGITQYNGNNGEQLTLQSIGSYPALGNQSIGRKPMSDLTFLDTLRSASDIVLHHLKWKPL